MTPRVLAVLAISLLSVSAVFAIPAEPPLPHPHFPKELTCRISKQLTIKIRYQTVTYNKKEAEKMAVGEAWFLAGATFETSGDLVVGGHKVEAGKYALSAKKAKKGWDLTLHEGHGFSLPGDDALVLATTFDGDAEMFEHMNIDVQPGGDKKNTQLYLDVRFDKLKAQSLIEIPK